MESISRAELLFAQKFGDAPKELRLRIRFALTALAKNSKGEALNELRKADALIKKHKLDELQAEMHAAWAFYQFHMGEEKEMYHEMAHALRLEPDNHLILELKAILDHQVKAS